MARFETTFWTDDKIEQLGAIMAQHPSKRPSREQIAARFGTTAIAIRRVCQRKKIHVATDDAEVFWTDEKVDTLRILMSLPPAQRPTLKRAAERFGTTENAVASICRRRGISVGRRTVATPAMRMTNPIVIRTLQQRVELPKRPAGGKFPRRKRMKQDAARDADLVANFLATRGVTRVPAGCADGALYVTIEDGR